MSTAAGAIALWETGYGAGAVLYKRGRPGHQSRRHCREGDALGNLPRTQGGLDLRSAAFMTGPSCGAALRAA